MQCVGDVRNGREKFLSHEKRRHELDFRGPSEDKWEDIYLEDIPGMRLGWAGLDLYDILEKRFWSTSL